MFGVCPNCRTAYNWDIPRFGCSCGYMSDVPPAESSASDYTALGRSPFVPSGWWGADRDRDRPRPSRTPDSPPSAATGRERWSADHDRELERDQRRREREEQQWDRWDRNRGRNRGGSRRRDRH